VPKLTKWKFLSRQPIPESVLIHASTGRHTLTYAVCQDRVTEVRKVNGAGEMRDRIETTKPVYLVERGDLALAFAVAIPALAVLERACRQTKPTRAEGER